ncbi:triphosphoribosyl-dephospho-CoA synthase [Paenibacillus sp. FSL H3-0333]|uniref:triphosphoribosyl-dephospho-CoA synthase n=1 Tax=Paenibacillus sp. FSL H3-0333 TaxID=2921373 RepID=UPI0030F81011
MLAAASTTFGAGLAAKAVQALVEEALLTPKPGLVDARDSGSHTDMSVGLMLASAHALEGTFQRIADVSYLHPVNQSLREKIAVIGREGEQHMLAATGGVNTHKGAIWALGLLTSVRAACPGEHDPNRIMSIAGQLASFEDRDVPPGSTNGQAVKRKYKIAGAAEEAQRGFPHIKEAALPSLLRARAAGKTEEEARIEALLALMSSVEDTCILHRGSWSDLIVIQQSSRAFLHAGGFSSQTGREVFCRLSEYCHTRRLSPGGSADLLAATLFLDRR